MAEASRSRRPEVMAAQAFGTAQSPATGRALARAGLDRRIADASWARRAADFDMRVFGEREAWPTADWRCLLESEDCLFLAYCRPAEGMQDVGDIVALGGIESWSGSTEAEILTLGVAQAWQGRGLGRLLLDDLLKCVGVVDGEDVAGNGLPEREEACGLRQGPVGSVRSVVLEVRADNVPARFLYESRGFRAVGCTRGVSGAWDGILMRKEIWDVSPSG